ncbi:MAG TPA: hypothetical protein VJT49_24180 [Amycolatopsis sp.]|uniref:hypothetical protein n=1 Tax=Amycolatopsis sp. TaxID=37632 RepID=UPI002B4869AF|nr:hypothetical protein [Amycolatopsis sp.]HKS48150.1 hypothetical protein [Amycolatopsis sp.]
MNFSGYLGPAAVVRPLLAEPGEHLLWAASGGVFYYDIEGLDALGEPSRGMLNRGLRAVGGFAGDFLFEALVGGDDSSPDKPPPADVIVFGQASGCLAHERIKTLGSAGKPGQWLWALSSNRLAVLGPRLAAAAASHKSEKTGLLKAALEFGKGVVNIATDRSRTYGPNLEGQPVARPDRQIRLRFSRAEIAGAAVAERRAKLRSRPCFRMSFVDGSGLDFVLRTDDPAVFQRMATLSHGGD